MSTRETPKTDALATKHLPTGSHPPEIWGLSRDLERQLAEALDERDEMRGALEALRLCPAIDGLFAFELEPADAVAIELADRSLARTGKEGV